MKMTKPEVPPEPQDEEAEEEPEVLLPNTTIVTHCVLKNDIGRLTQCFENDADPYKENIAELIVSRDDDGKSPLDVASTLGRVDMVKELAQRGADVNSITEKGYSALHHAAAWGRVDVIKALVDLNCNLQQRNAHGERARETAVRYNKTECVDFLDWAEAKVDLLALIRTTQETVQDPEKSQGKFSKEDKSTLLNTCKEKAEWVEATPGATTQDFIEQKAVVQEIISPILVKLTEPPPEKPEKK